MKECPQCKEPNPDKLNFCGYCGTNLNDGEIEEIAKLHNELAKANKLLQLYEQQKELLEKTNKDLLLSYDTLKKKAQKTKPPISDDLTQQLSAVKKEFNTLKNNYLNIQRQLTDTNEKNQSLKKSLAKKYYLPWCMAGALIFAIIVISIKFQNNHHNLVLTKNALENSRNVIYDYSVSLFDGTIYDYSGTLKDNLPEGFGKAKYNDGKIYVGPFKNGLRHGKGKTVFPDGATYEGDYVDDKAEGYGEKRYPDGFYYKGEWKNDKQNGLGAFYNADGKVQYSGEWENGRPKEK